MHHKPRGWQSTKLHLALICMATVTVVYGLTGFAPAAFGEFTMALLGAAGIYSTANAVEKFAPRNTKPPEGT